MSSITVRLLVLLLVAALPVFAVQVSNQIEQRDQQRAHTIAQANRFAHAVAQEQERLIEGMRYLLTALAQLPSVRNHEASCSARLTGIADPLLSIGRLGAATPDGKEIGRAHVWTPVTNAQLVCRLLLDKKKKI